MDTEKFEWLSQGDVLYYTTARILLHVCTLPETPGVSKSEVVSMALEVMVVVVASPVVTVLAVALASILC